MDAIAWIGLGLQTVVILGGIVVLHMRTRDRITTLEVNHKGCDRAILMQRQDHNKLEERVGGISRHVERLRGKAE